MLAGLLFLGDSRGDCYVASVSSEFGATLCDIGLTSELESCLCGAAVEPNSARQKHDV